MTHSVNPPTLLLPLRFDPLRLQADLQRVAADTWQTHFNSAIYSGDWSGVPLRAVPGSPIAIYSDPTAQDRWTDTPLLDECAYFREVLAQFACPLLSVRLLRLAPGAIIKEHRDYGLGLDCGEVRIHVVISTNPDVDCCIDGQHYHWAAGECWYADFSLPHSFTNNGDSMRVHMVLDCQVNDWLLQLLAAKPARLVNEELAVTMDEPGTGWIPLYLKNGCVEWAYMGQERFLEPFCQETLQKIAAKPFNRLFRRQSGLETLLQRAVSHPGLPPGGIIFHMSRCGSTLLAQSLAALPDNVVLSEPEAVDTLLQWLNDMPDGNGTAGAELLRALLSALGQARRAEDRRVFWKTDCWHMCRAGEILSAFPGVPWLFLYRDPLEVLVSQMRMPALYQIPGSMARHGLHPPPELLTRPLEHGAWVLEQVLCAAAEAIRHFPNGLLLNYSELPAALETRVAQHFSLQLHAAELAALRSATFRDAKQPHRTFQTDGAAKQAEVDERLREIAAHRLDTPYAALERLRLPKKADDAAAQTLPR